MGLLADAINTRSEKGEVMVGSIGYVAGADFCMAFTEADAVEIERGDVPIWCIRFTVLTPDRVREAKSRGASWVSCTLDELQAEVALDPEFDFVVRLLETDMDESSFRALARMGPAAISPAPQFPLSLRDAVNVHRLATITGIPLAIICSVEVSASDLEILRDAGLGLLALPRGATPDDVAAVKRRIAELPAPASE